MPMDSGAVMGILTKELAAIALLGCPLWYDARNVVHINATISCLETRPD